MQRLGYKYCTRKKSYYVDNHKRAEQHFHRKEFTEEYLLNLEPYCHRWIQVSKAQLYMWFTDQEINFDRQYYSCGYHYENEDGDEYIKFHVDTNEFIHEEASRRFEFGGTTSIRVKGEVFRPIIIFGQDESAFHQYLLKSKNWRGPKGETVLLPKSNGIAVVVSAIISRDTGFGLQLASMKLAKNISR
jgi:hypothetical protein